MILNLRYVVTSMPPHRMLGSLLLTPQGWPSGEWVNYCAYRYRDELVRSLPGMGATLTAEFLAEAVDLKRYGTADKLAAAAGVTPILRASGNTSRNRRSRRGNRILKFVFRSAFCLLRCHEASQTFYRRKRSEGKAHTQAVMALARWRVNVLWAMLPDGLL